MFKIVICCLWASFALAETAAPKVVNFLFLGKTQTGKSTLINIFYSHIMGKKYDDQRAVIVPLRVGTEEWKVNVPPYEDYEVELRGLGQSQTAKVLCYTAKNARYVVNLWDAPGFNDTKQKITDEEIVKSIALAVGETSFNAVVIALRPDEPETFDMKANIGRIRNMLPKSASKNIIGIYTRSAASPARGVKNSRAQAFANLLELPQGTTASVYSIDGSSFFEEVDLTDESSLEQGRARWFNDGKAITAILADVGEIKPFDAAKVKEIQINIETIDTKIKERKESLNRLDDVVEKIKKEQNNRKTAEAKRDDNKKYDKEKILTIEKEVPNYERRWYTLGLVEHEDGTKIEHHQGTAKYTDEEQKAHYNRALAEIELANHEEGLSRADETTLRKLEHDLLVELVSLEKTRRHEAIDSDLDAFIVYLNLQIDKASKDSDKVRGESRKAVLQARIDSYERIKDLDKHIRGDL